MSGPDTLLLLTIMCNKADDEAVTMRGRVGTRGAVSAAVLLLTACGSADPSGAGAASGAAVPAGTGTLRVAASVYPLQWLAEQIGGDAVTVSSLTGAGVEPHDLELTPRDVGALGDADLVVYLAGLAPAVDAAVEQQGADNSFDVGRAARLVAIRASAGGGGQSESTAPDPHFWLDPGRMADVADALAMRLGEVDPGGAAAYAANAGSVRAVLDTLDRELAAGLATCRSRDVVTTHAAFGYLAGAYGLTQVAVSGLTPEADPSPADLSAAAAFVRGHGVTTVYAETPLRADVAETLARETGADTAVLDPLETLTRDSPGADYPAVMRANLATLRAGQQCP